MTVYATKSFARFASKAKLDDDKLLDAAQAVMNGHFDADLGGAVFKQRVARTGGGKSGGYRAILLFRIGAHCFFAHGFAKNAKANVSSRELKGLRELAVVLLGLSADEIEAAVLDGKLREVVTDDGDEDDQAV